MYRAVPPWSAIENRPSSGLPGVVWTWVLIWERRASLGKSNAREPAAPSLRQMSHVGAADCPMRPGRLPASIWVCPCADGYIHVDAEREAAGCSMPIRVVLGEDSFLAREAVG